MEKILTQQAESLQKLEALSKEDKANQLEKMSKETEKEKQDKKLRETVEGIKESLDEGNTLQEKQITNLERMAKNLKDIDFNRIADLAKKDVPLSIGDKLKQSLAALNPLKAMDAVTSKFKNLFSTEKGRYVNEQARELRRQDPSMSVEESKNQAKIEYDEARDAKLAQRQIDYAIDNDKEIPASAVAIANNFKKKQEAKEDSEKEGDSPLFSNEEERESGKLEETKIRLLTQIEENTRGDGQGSGETPGLGGLLGGLKKKVMGFFAKIGPALIGGLKSIFSAKFLLAALKKVFVPLAIIGALFSGITDAIDEFKKTGSIGDAVIAGLGGILDFLTFGLVDKDTLLKLGDTVNEYLIEPIKNFFAGIKNWVVEKASKLPFVGDKIKEVFGNPDASESPQPTPATKIETTPPSSGAVITRVSSENDEARLAQSSNQSSNIINAPTTNISGTTNNNLIKPIVRNSDNSYNNLVKSKYSYI